MSKSFLGFAWKTCSLGSVAGWFHASRSLLSQRRLVTQPLPSAKNHHQKQQALDLAGRFTQSKVYLLE